MIQIDNLTFGYPNAGLIFKDYSFNVERDQVWAVIGPSGCGKTTLLNLLAGLIRPTRGHVVIDGLELSRPRPRTGLILQDYGLLPWATVWDNVMLGLRIRAFYGPDGIHSPRDERTPVRPDSASHWLKRLGIDHLAKKYPHEISGGQRQRTAIARTLVLEPDLLLMDEPFGALDAPTREDLQNLTLQLHREHSLTTILVTHNIEEAAFMGQQILVLARPVHHTPAIINNPQAGSATYRQEETFRERCQQLGRMIGRENDEMA